MKTKNILLYVLLISIQTLSAQCWNLVWEDEFTGSTLDNQKWTAQTGGNGWGNNELQHYTSRVQNIVVSNGTLKIIALAENYGGNSYTSARLRSLNKGDWSYGKFEARIKLPVAQGMWPAFWMLPSQSVYGTWPQSGEMDIMELVGTTPARVYGTIHTVQNGSTTQNYSYGNQYNLASGNFSNAFHDFRLEWSPNLLKWHVDGVLYSTATPANLAGNPWRFDKDFHLLLNLAVGGTWPGSPNASTIFPQTMEVEYVKVYQQLQDFVLKGKSTVEPLALGEIYTVPNVAGAIYTWTVPTGASIVSGQGTAQITVNFGTTSGNVSCAISTTCGNASPQKAVTVTANLLANPSFENDLNNWNTNYYNGGSATPSTSVSASAPDSTHIACIQVGSLGVDPWNVQFSQTNLPLVANQSYTLSFSAKAASNNQPISVAVINASTFNVYFGQSISLGTNWQNYTYQFTPSVSATAQVNFDLGYQTGNICLDKVFLGKNLVLALPVESINDLQLYPNPIQGGKAKLVSSSNIENLTILDYLGRNLPISWELNPSGATIDCKQLPKGVYYLNVFSTNVEVQRLHFMIE